MLVCEEWNAAFSGTANTMWRGWRVAAPPGFENRCFSKREAVGSTPTLVATAIRPIRSSARIGNRPGRKPGESAKSRLWRFEPSLLRH